MSKRSLSKRRIGAFSEISGSLLAAAVTMGAFAVNAHAEDSGKRLALPKCECQASLRAASGVLEVIAASLKGDKNICTAVTPVIVADPCAAADLIAAAKIHAELLDQLAQCLSSIQLGLKEVAPDKAILISKAVSCAPPAFQAAYAVALVPGGDPEDSGGLGDDGLKGGLEPQVAVYPGFEHGGGTPGGGGNVSPSVP